MANCDHSTLHAFGINKVLKAGTTAIACLALVACASDGKQLDAAGEDADYKEQVSVYSNPSADPNGMDPVAAAAFWGVKYDRDPKDWKAAVNYSTALRKIGSVEQSVKVMSKVSKFFGEEADVALETARALIEAGRAFEAIRHVEIAHRANPEDWRTLSVYGVALDQIGEHKTAQLKYEQALTIAPGVVSILNNKGLSYALDGNLSKAKSILRAAASAPGADARVRQNLALVLAIKGDMLEAERLARSDLPPQVADSNINFYRSLVVQPAYWQDFAAEDIQAPFKDEPADQELLGGPVNAPATPTALIPTTKKEVAVSPLAQPEEIKVSLEKAALPTQPVEAETSQAATGVSNTAFDPALELGLSVDDNPSELDSNPIYIDPLSADDSIIDLKEINQ
ncbi:MAG: hypothetical protein AAF720_03905 [Pseudomonadota bacterium]